MPRKNEHPADSSQDILQDQVNALIELTRRLKQTASCPENVEILTRLINAQCRVSAALLRLLRQMGQDQPESSSLLEEALERYWKQAGGEEKRA